MVYLPHARGSLPAKPNFPVVTIKETGSSIIWDNFVYPSKTTRVPLDLAIALLLGTEGQRKEYERIVRENDPPKGNAQIADIRKELDKIRDGLGSSPNATVAENTGKLKQVIEQVQKLSDTLDGFAGISESNDDLFRDIIRDLLQNIGENRDSLVSLSKAVETLSSEQGNGKTLMEQINTSLSQNANALGKLNSDFNTIDGKINTAQQTLNGQVNDLSTQRTGLADLKRIVDALELAKIDPKFLQGIQDRQTQQQKEIESALLLSASNQKIQIEFEALQYEREKVRDADLKTLITREGETRESAIAEAARLLADVIEQLNLVVQQNSSDADDKITRLQSRVNTETKDLGGRADSLQSRLSDAEKNAVAKKDIQDTEVTGKELLWSSEKVSDELVKVRNAIKDVIKNDGDPSDDSTYSSKRILELIGDKNDTGTLKLDDFLGSRFVTLLGRHAKNPFLSNDFKDLLDKFPGVTSMALSWRTYQDRNKASLDRLGDIDKSAAMAETMKNELTIAKPKLEEGVRNGNEAHRLIKTASRGTNIINTYPDLELSDLIDDKTAGRWMRSPNLSVDKFGRITKIVTTNGLREDWYREHYMVNPSIPAGAKVTSENDRENYTGFGFYAVESAQGIMRLVPYQNKNKPPAPASKPPTTGCRLSITYVDNLHLGKVRYGTRVRIKQCPSTVIMNDIQAERCKFYVGFFHKEMSQDVIAIAPHSTKNEGDKHPGRFAWKPPSTGFYWEGSLIGGTPLIRTVMFDDVLSDKMKDVPMEENQNNSWFVLDVDFDYDPKTKTNFVNFDFYQAGRQNKDTFRFTNEIAMMNNMFFGLIADNRGAPADTFVDVDYWGFSYNTEHEVHRYSF